MVEEDLGIEDHAGSDDAGAVRRLEEVSALLIRSCSLGNVGGYLRDGDSHKTTTHDRGAILLGVGLIWTCKQGYHYSPDNKRAQQPTTGVSISGMQPIRSMTYA